MYSLRVATTGALAGGCVLGWSSPAEYEILKNNGYDFAVSEEQWSWVGSLATVGGVCSCALIGVIMDALGRKNTMLALIIPFSIGWALITWPASVISLYVGRFAAGFAGGAFFVVAPAYIGEIATKNVRGTLSSYLQLMVTVGILFAYVVGHFFTLKTFNMICAMLPLIFGAVFVWMPETPYFYVMKNRLAKAEESLKWLRGEEYNYNDELIEIQIENELLARNRVSALAALQKPATKRALMISMCLVLFVQFSGINAVIFYTGFIFDATNSGIQASIATIIVGVMQVVATFVASLTVDKLGRRALLVISAVVMCICNIGLGIYFYLRDAKSDYITHLNWLPISSLCVYIIAFSLGLGPIPWVLVAEIFTTEAKAIASSMTGATSWLIAFFVTKFFSNIRDLIGIGQTFWAFAVFSAICTIFVAIKVPETKGKSFNEIQKSLLAGASSDSHNNHSEQDENHTTDTNASENTIAI